MLNHPKAKLLQTKEEKEKPCNSRRLLDKQSETDLQRTLGMSQGKMALFQITNGYL